jgi:hypothetical protein
VIERDNLDELIAKCSLKVIIAPFSLDSDQLSCQVYGLVMLNFEVIVVDSIDRERH